MGFLRCVDLIAGLVALPFSVLGLPFDNAQPPTATPTPEWAPGYSFTLPPILKRDDAVKPVCDWTCTHRILYQAAYSAVSLGIEYAMVTYDAQGWCFEQESAWCPQVVESQTTAIAARSSYMEIDYGACDEPCLLISMAEIARRGALYGMQWAEQAFPPENSTVSEDAVQKLLWTMWYLNKNFPSINGGALDGGGHAQSWNSSISNATSPLSSSDTSPSSSKRSMSSDKAAAEITSSHPATNLLAEYVTSDGACSDPYLCQVDNYMQISSVMKKAQSSVNGSTWLGFMLADGGSGEPGRKATFPTYANRPPCTGCPPLSDAVPQRPPPNWTPERIPDPPANPDAPEIPHEPVTPPQEDEDTKRRLKEADEEEKRKAREHEQQQTKEKCGDDEECKAKEDRKHDEERKVEAQDEAERKQLEDEVRTVEQEHLKKDPEEVEAKCKGNEACEQDEWQKKDDERKVREQKADEEAQDLQDLQAARKECKGKQPCMGDKLREIKDEREVQDEKDRKADEARNEQVYQEIKSKCQGNQQCEKTEHDNEKAREKMKDYKSREDEDRKHGWTDARSKAEKHSSLRHGDATVFNDFEPPFIQPRPVFDLDRNARYRAQVYNPKTGTMEQLELGNLRFHPMEERRVFLESGVTKSRAKTLHEAGMKPFQLMKDGEPFRKVVWHNMDELITMTDDTWEKAGDHMFKKINGKPAINRLGEPLVAGPSKPPPRTLRPEPPQKGVSYDGTVRYKWDAEDPENPGKMGTKEIDFDSHAAHPEEPVGREGDAWHQGQEQDDIDNHRPKKWDADDAHKPQRIPDPAYNYPKAKHWDVQVHGPLHTPGPSPGGHGSDGDNEADKDRNKDGKDKDGKKVNPKKIKFPQGLKVTDATKVVKLTIGPKAVTNEVGLYFAILGLELEEVWMMGEANGDAHGYWDCLKSRYMPWLPDHCNMVDENGNYVESPDRGPLRNFFHNEFGWAIDKDIDGDGELENVWQRFVDSMEDTGKSIHDFFDDDDDGMGWKENGANIIIDAAETAVNVVENVGGKIWNSKPVKWLRDKAKKVAHFFGIGDDDDDDED